MKILIVTQYFWPEEFRINDLAISLKNRGHEITILTGMPNYPGGSFFKGYGYWGPFTESFEGMPVYRVPVIPRGKGNGMRLLLNFISFVITGCILAPFRLKEKVDIVFVYEVSPITVALPALVLKKIKKAPLMLWVLDLWPETLEAIGVVRSRSVLSLVRLLVKFIYKRCDRILMQSGAFAGSIKAFNVGSDRLLYFPNSAEDSYKPVVLDDRAPERREVPKGFVVMFAGNIGVAQDFGTILDSAGILSKYPDIHFVVLGIGRAFDWVVEQVDKRQLKSTVHLLGRHPKESMPRYFSLADVMLVTLKKEPIFALTIPAKVQSYLACGKPIIAALDGEGSRIIQEAEAGIVVPAENAQGLAEAILSMYRMSADERRIVGERGLRYFKTHFDPALLADRLNTWMKELVAGSTP
jgi:colanic acid biosynthesis glycosyl transferase WcaI